MIKKCTVISRNELVMVVEYDEKKIQFPTDKKTDDFVYVKFENENYSISDKESYDSDAKKDGVVTRRKRKKEKEVVVNENINEEENSEL